MQNWFITSLMGSIPDVRTVTTTLSHGIIHVYVTERSLLSALKTAHDCQDATLSQINLLKPTGHVIHQQFNIQQLYILPTLYLCVLYLSENKQPLVPLTA